MRPSHATAESRAQARPKLAVSPWASQLLTSVRQRDGPSAGAPLLAAPSVFYARWPRIRQGDAVHYSRNAKQFPACNKYDHSFWNTSHLEVAQNLGTVVIESLPARVHVALPIEIGRAHV